MNNLSPCESITLALSDLKKEIEKTKALRDKIFERLGKLGKPYEKTSI